MRPRLNQQSRRASGTDAALRNATRWNAAYSRCSRLACRNCAVCAAVHTATGLAGLLPPLDLVLGPESPRAARAVRAAPDAARGLCSINPPRTATFNATLFVRQAAPCRARGPW